MSTTNTCQMAYAILHSFRGRLCFVINSSAGQNHCPAKKKYERVQQCSSALALGSVSLGSVVSGSSSCIFKTVDGLLFWDNRRKKLIVDLTSHIKTMS